MKQSNIVISKCGTHPIRYRVTDTGTAYHAKTAPLVVDILERARQTGMRLRLFYGNTKTGRDWMEEFETAGTVGRSTGAIKIPLLIKQNNSLGGGGILDHCIVRIMHGRCELYRHPKYKLPNLKTRLIEPGEMCGKVNMWAEGYRVAVTDRKGREIANFKTANLAARWIAFMRGERGAK